VRHHLLAHPELSYQEFETSKYIQSKLKEFGIPFEVMATHAHLEQTNFDSRAVRKESRPSW
jgi:metal-dependent amidase/aminoacylase/carboxypeptidase family protein